jgi:PAS domain S-box-containing protein
MKENLQPADQSYVLIVDDIETNRILIENILKPTGANLILAQSGAEALKKSANHDIALALIDIGMPEMNGFDLVKLMQKNAGSELIPVIFITAHTGDQSEIEKYYSTGVVDCILKPFRNHILLNKVKVFLELHRQKLQIRNQKAEMELMVKELEEGNRVIQIRLAYENLLTKISEMAVSGKCTDDFFDKSLATIGRSIEASRTYIIEYCCKTETLSNTYEWCAECITPQKENLQALPVSEIPWWHNTLKNAQTINYYNIEDIPEQSTKNILKAQDISSILVVPLFATGKYFGHIGFDFCYGQRKWYENDVELLVSISRILSSVIERNIAEKEMQKKVETEHALINALRESEKMYRTLLSASPQGIVILDMKRVVTDLSDITIEIFGAGSINDFIGKDFFSIIPSRGKEKLKTILSKTLSDGLVQNEEVILEKKNRYPFVSEISATLIQEKNGTPKAYMIIIRDISKKKIMEQQLIRTERLISLGEMASGMAHEINQPLLSIQLGIENLLNKVQQTNTTGENYLKRKSEKIFEDIVRISHIIDHIRAFSKDQEYIRSAFNINDSIKNAVSMISQQFKYHGIKITFKPGEKVYLIYGNTFRFEQVMLNMLSNAKDAVEEKSKELKMDFNKNVIIRSYHDDDCIYVEVKDNGAGIDPVGIDRILLPFHTTKERGKGTGLGLAISFSIVKELDGNIEIESQKGVGSTFRIKLPKSSM